MTTVARWRSTSSRKGSKANRGNVTTVAPEVSALVSVMTKPMTWAKGATAATVSRGPSFSPARACAMATTTFAWVSMTPLGRPVVPLE